MLDHGAIVARGTPAELKRVAGAQAVTVRPADPGRLAAAAAILSAVTGNPPGPARRGELTASVRAGADGDAVFAAVAGRLREAGIAATELSLRLPSLNEVFAALTGRPAARKNAAEEAGAAGATEASEAGGTVTVRPGVAATGQAPTEVTAS